MLRTCMLSRTFARTNDTNIVEVGMHNAILRNQLNIFGSNFLPDVKNFSYSFSGKAMNYRLI